MKLVFYLIAFVSFLYGALCYVRYLELYESGKGKTTGANRTLLNGIVSFFIFGIISWLIIGLGITCLIIVILGTIAELFYVYKKRTEFEGNVSFSNSNAMKHVAVILSLVVILFTGIFNLGTKPPVDNALSNFSSMSNKTSSSQVISSTQSSQQYSQIQIAKPKVESKDILTRIQEASVNFIYKSANWGKNLGQSLTSGGHFNIGSNPDNSKNQVVTAGLNGLSPAGGGAYYVNNDQSDLNADITSSPWVSFSPVDSLDRPQVANAWLNNTTRIYKSRNETGNAKTINPVGFHQNKINNEFVYNRGHLLAYALIGGMKDVNASEANRQNIITQTAWSNQSSEFWAKGQNYWEAKVRKALDNHKSVRYQVKPYYVGTDLVARGVFIQAKSSDGSLNFNVYVPNVQPKVNIDYRTGFTNKE